MKARRCKTLGMAVLVAALALMLVGFQVPANPNVKFAFDMTDTLSSETTSIIQNINDEMTRTVGAQVAVLMISTLGDDSLEDAALETFRAWGIGDKTKNNGVLLLIAKEDRALRIEVGYGLEGAIPDSVASDIIRNVIAPYFKNDDYDQGVLAGFNAIVTLIAKEYGIDIESEGFEPQDYAEDEISDGLAAAIGIVTFAGAVYLIFRGIKSGGGDDTYYGGGHYRSSGGGSSGGSSFGGGSSGGGGASGGW